MNPSVFRSVFKCSWKTFFAWSLVLLNLFLVYQTGRAHFIRSAKSYTWINKDYPLEMPTGDIPTVEMTFQESSRFLLDANSKDNWDTLIYNQFGIGFQHLGPYNFRHISGAYHSLHCVYSMWEDFDKPNHLTDPSHHLIHCLMYFRQIFLCNADMTLEDGDFMKRNYTTTRTADTRKCRDWSTVAKWVDNNSRDWLRFNGIEVDELPLASD